MDEKKALGLLGIARKAGKVADGAFLSERSIKSGRSCLIIISTDCTEGTYDKFKGMCENRHIPFIRHFNMDTLGHILGRSDRSVVSIEDKGFSEKLTGLLSD